MRLRPHPWEFALYDDISPHGGHENGSDDLQVRSAGFWGALFLWALGEFGSLRTTCARFYVRPALASTYGPALASWAAARSTRFESGPRRRGCSRSRGLVPSKVARSSWMLLSRARAGLRSCFNMLIW